VAASVLLRTVSDSEHLRTLSTYTAAEAARILRLSSQRVRQLLASGELRGVRDEVGHWEVDARSVHELLNERREAFSEALEDLQRLSELEAEVRELRYLLGRADAHVELRAQAESNLREALKRERERADRLEAELIETRKTSPEPAETPQMASEETARGTATPGGQEPSERPSWWRSFFGLE
jgi:excisionase family DNA binding protein